MIGMMITTTTIIIHRPHIITMTTTILRPRPNRNRGQNRRKAGTKASASCKTRP